jgi:hypothetical protein
MAVAPSLDKPWNAVPGWDRRRRWTLRFVDPALERAYRAAMAPPSRQRLRIAAPIGVGLWLFAAVFGPPLLGIPAPPFHAVAAVQTGWLAIVAFLALRDISLPQLWALGAVTTVLSALGIVIALGTGEVLVSAGAAALMLNAVVAIALVRLAAWLAATLSVITVLLFVSVALSSGIGGIGVFQAFLLVGLLFGATVGAYYLEAAERTAFAQGHLVADLHRRVDRLFRQYLSPDVADALIDDPMRADLGGEVAEVTVHGRCAHGGLQCPHSPGRPRAPRLPCRTRPAAPDGRGRWRATMPQFRVGINSGPALVGNVGSAQLHNFLAIGDTTNVAARLQSYAPPGRVVLGEQTYDLVRGSVDVRSLGTPDLKGKSVPTEVYELIGLGSRVA